ncbi:DUF6441 family protein [Paracoccus jeotgali]|uniref:Uncharacterized protein n=1 Tax=Paracoccus jeotgali TaxID=2065379 RepID=A0A2K9MBF6_9RHOB|nr:DUF6441 family protein [Paracoccus jeotgali]AUM72960.1 hypothetical protein CYR75_00345 [Paracoccus jeotgali]
MKLRAEFTDLARLMADEVKAGEKAVHFGIRDAGVALKTVWRGQVTGAGLGQRLARTIRSETWPKHKHSMNAASMVWTRAPVIVSAHDTGPLIRSRDGFWLAIPSEAAGKSRTGKRPTPGEWERRTGMRLRFVYRPNGPSLLIAEGRIAKGGRAVASRSRTGRGLTSIPIFLLVPQVKLRKRLDLEKPAQAALAALPAAILRKWSDMP